MAENYIIVNKAFDLLRDELASYVSAELMSVWKEMWWQTGVLDSVKNDTNLKKAGSPQELMDSMDIILCLKLLADVHWKEVFRKKLPNDCRTWAKELQDVRHNYIAHRGKGDITQDKTRRALDTMALLCEQTCNTEITEKIREIYREFTYGSAKGSTDSGVVRKGAENSDKTSPLLPISYPTSSTGLPSWRDVMTPHQDVSEGRYKNAEFAADLAQVARGEGSIEYKDPVEFFNRTYITEGLKGLLIQALRRIGGMDGEPVLQLKTAFGGGKTHSMLALYHLFRGGVDLQKTPDLKPVLEEAGMTKLPKVHVVVLVGTALEPAKSKRPNDLPGITINTLWGEIAAQLVKSTGKQSLYDIIKESDKKGVAPGSETLKRLFDEAGSCIVLMDELVRYANKIYGKDDLPAGTYGNFISFVQEITEAARASKNSLVVASIPESEREIGGEAGHNALRTIEHFFGRTEAIWQPVKAHEGFEVVRRRLFLECKNLEGRDKVCNAFSKMYIENSQDFPLEAREVEYRDRMVSCYPIHPEVFDRLYDDWATLDGFQRTRGVLRLMAAVIHELWMGNDAGHMIMPGSLPLDKPQVRDELTKHLPEGWHPVVDRDVDGVNSIPYQQDKNNQRYGKSHATRRVARTVMLGSAPSTRGQNLRGIEASRIRLGVVQPGENIANFNDALGTLQSSLTYLYSTGDRYWYDTRPTLRRLATDRATQISDSDVEHEIKSRLNRLRTEQPFSGIHICPASSLDVPDEQSVRLVILSPADEYRQGNKANCAMTATNDYLTNRGSNPRIYRNMLAFLAPDGESMNSLKQSVRLYLAWNTIRDNRESLDLGVKQMDEVEKEILGNNKTVERQMREAYCLLLVPHTDKNDLKTIQWSSSRISGSNDGIITKAAKKMHQDGAAITDWAPIMLKMELDGLLWRDDDHIGIEKLWNYLCAYCYLPRLKDENVLFKTIKAGVESTEYFAFASGLDGSRYIDLKFNQSLGKVERSGYLVKIAVAKKQIDAEKEEEEKKKGTSTGVGKMPIDEPTQPTPLPLPHRPKNKRFYMSADLDTVRINKDVQEHMENIIKHLASVEGAQVKVSLEVEAESAEGFDQQTVRTVSENCKTMRVKSSGFDG